MDPVQLHLLTNHIPVLGVLFATLALAVGVLGRSRPIARFGIACLAGAAIAVVPVYFSGEPAEESLENAVSLSETSVDRHEDAAGTAAILLAALGAAALFVWLRSRSGDGLPRASRAVLVAALAVSAIVIWTAHLGGQIRHTELDRTKTAGVEGTMQAPDDD
jgi:uncharacterized membrane protein